MPCWGKLPLISRRITASAARSASVTGSKSWVLLLSIESEVRKNGRMVSPDVVARRPIKAVKSMTVTAIPLGMKRVEEFLRPCLAQSGRPRTGHAHIIQRARAQRARYRHIRELFRLRIHRRISAWHGGFFDD